MTSYLLEELRTTQSRLQRIESALQSRNLDQSTIQQELNSKLQVFMSSVLNETGAQLRERNLGKLMVHIWQKKKVFCGDLEMCMDI